MPKPNQQYLRYLFYYSHNTGKLFRRISVNSKAQEGTELNIINGNGYMQVTIDYKIYLLHRLIWCYVYNYWPENDIDHINGVKTDNHLPNLREASASCNKFNAKNPVGIIGIRGVQPEGKKYRATLGSGKVIGSYPTKIEAACARFQEELDRDICTGANYEGSAAQYINDWRLRHD